MTYTLIFLIRFYPFWAIPLGIVFYELTVHFFHRRERSKVIFLSGSAGFLVLTTVLWLVFEGYWRAADMVKSLLPGN